MTAGLRRWWATCGLRRNPLVRRVDRVQAWSLVAGIVVLVIAAQQASAYSATVYAARSHDVVVESAKRHAVEATALADSTSSAKGPASATRLVYSDHVQWFEKNATHDDVVKIDRPVKAGDRVGIWLDDQGKVTSAPPTDDGAHADAIGVAALLWLLCLAIVTGALEILRRVLDRARRRAWDRELRLLVDNGGGSSTTRTP
jgi:hypothetical protein